MRRYKKRMILAPERREVYQNDQESVDIVHLNHLIHLNQPVPSSSLQMSPAPSPSPTRPDRQTRPVAVRDLWQESMVDLGEDTVAQLDGGMDGHVPSRLPISAAGEMISAALCNHPENAILLAALGDLKITAVEIDSAYMRDGRQMSMRPRLRRILEMIQHVGQEGGVVFTTSDGDQVTGTLRRFEMPQSDGVDEFILWIEPSSPVHGLDLCRKPVDAKAWSCGSAGISWQSDGPHGADTREQPTRSLSGIAG